MLISDKNVYRDKEIHHIMIRIQVAKKTLQFKNVSCLCNLCNKNRTILLGKIDKSPIALGILPYFS